MRNEIGESVKKIGGEKKKKMKTKTKILTIVEIAIVLCSVFLVATLPAIAADTQKVSTSEVTTASEDDYVLGVYGNANEDDTIDMGDVVYIKLVIFGKKDKTELCDAKYDERINVLDVIQTKLIILGKEKELTIVDSADSILTVKKPVKRIVALHSICPEMIKAVGAKDRLVGVGTWVAKAKVFYPEISELPDCGWNPVNIELIIQLKPDIVIIPALSSKGELEDKLEPAGIKVVQFNFMHSPEMEKEAITLGYILDTEDEAQNYVNFVEQCLEAIKQEVEELTEEEKPRVYLTARRPTSIGEYTCSREGPGHGPCVFAGGINIAADLAGGKNWFKVDPEWVLRQDPEIVYVNVPPYFFAYAEDDPAQMMEWRKEFIGLPGWENMNAVRNDRVYISSVWIATRPSYFIEVAYLAKLFHPDLFEDLDPEAIHQEYLTRFQRLDYDLNEHGIFAYPPIILGKDKLAGIPDRYYDSIVAQP